MNEDEKRARLIGWLETIFSEVQDLLLDDYIFWQLQGIVGQNPRFKDCSGMFRQWMASAFVQATAVGVRRQAKTGDDSVSLRRFLNEVQRCPSLVSRAQYMSLYQGLEPWRIELGKRDFDHVAGEGAAHIPKALIEQQIQELKQAIHGIEHYVDRRIAHYDRRGLLAQATPTFAELTQALRTLEKTVIQFARFSHGAVHRVAVIGANRAGQRSLIASCLQSLSWRQRKAKLVGFSCGPTERL